MLHQERVVFGNGIQPQPRPQNARPVQDLDGSARTSRPTVQDMVVRQGDDADPQPDQRVCERVRGVERGIPGIPP